MADTERLSQETLYDLLRDELRLHDGFTLHIDNGVGVKLDGEDVTLTTEGLTVAEAAFLVGVEAGVAAASKALVLDANKDVGIVRNLTLSGNLAGATIVALKADHESPAAAGADQAGATALTKTVNTVTGADAAKGVRLPAAAAGKALLVVNTVADQTLKVYPATGAKIDGGAANAAKDLDGGERAVFVSDGTDWYSLIGA